MDTKTISRDAGENMKPNIMKSEPSHERPITNGDMGSNTFPEHMSDPKSENWTKYGNDIGFSNKISILTHDSSYGKRFIGPNMDTEDNLVQEVDLDVSNMPDSGRSKSERLKMITKIAPM